MKRCWKCKEIKTYSKFYKDKSRGDSYNCSCRECHKILGKKRFRKKQEKFGGLYGIWGSMKQRCSNSKCTGYKHYGARGITVCQEWQTSFQSFYNWAIDNGHRKGLEIDRKNNDGNYEPSNCRFVTAKENIRNSSRAKLNIEKVKEIKKLLKEKNLKHFEIAALFGIGRGAVSNIVINRTWKEV